ncbi:MAG: TatD family hydrolase [Weeksellaceae bacterium]
MFDTHCHLNFKAFKKNLPDVITRAREAGVSHILMPGTDVKTSRKAIEIAEAYDNMFVAVGIHPHHVFDLLKRDDITIETELTLIEELVNHPKVVAIGEIGIDRHVYEETKYQEYAVSPEFISLQTELFTRQIQLAKKHKKSLIVHNREAKADVLSILTQEWDLGLEHRSVLHCCEPEKELLDYIKEHKMFIGVDGDLTYSPEKQAFYADVPLELIVVETDSPFLLPEPLKSQRLYPNEPKNIPLVIAKLAEVQGRTSEEVAATTFQNAKRLFNL